MSSDSVRDPVMSHPPPLPKPTGRKPSLSSSPNSEPPSPHNNSNPELIIAPPQHFAHRDVSNSSNGTITNNKNRPVSPGATPLQPPQPPQPVRRSSFGLNFFSSITSSMRPNLQSSSTNTSNGTVNQGPSSPSRENPHSFMSNSPTIANLHNYNSTTAEAYSEEAAFDPIHETSHDVTVTQDSAVQLNGNETSTSSHNSDSDPDPAILPSNGAAPMDESTPTEPINRNNSSVSNDDGSAANGMDKDGFYSVRLTPLIDHSSSSSGLYFAPVIRKLKSNNSISIGRYTEKNKSAAHAPQGSSAPIVFKSKVVSRTHALFQCNEEGQWFLKDCKSSSGTFLNHIRLSPASQESTLMPLIDGDIIQLGMDYRGGTEEVYRCVKMRCEFNKSWQRKVNQFNLEIHKKLKNLAISNNNDEVTLNNPIGEALAKDELSECAICLLKLEPCQALFISPCSHSWHYKCIRPIIVKSYPQFYCPNCRSMCDLETDIEDDDD